MSLYTELLWCKDLKKPTYTKMRLAAKTIYCVIYKNIILSTLATEQPLGYEIYNITLSSVAGFGLGTSTC